MFRIAMTPPRPEETMTSLVAWPRENAARPRCASMKSSAQMMRTDGEVWGKPTLGWPGFPTSPPMIGFEFCVSQVVEYFEGVPECHKCHKYKKT
jgi:hypothetical protein